MRRLALILSTTLAPIPALAHPGAHTEALQAVGHFLTDPFHVLFLLAALVGAPLAARAFRGSGAPARQEERSHPDA